MKEVLTGGEGQTASSEELNESLRVLSTAEEDRKGTERNKEEDRELLESA